MSSNFELENPADYYKWRKDVEFQAKIDDQFSKKDLLLSIKGRARDQFLIHNPDITGKNIMELLDILEEIMVGQTTMTELFGQIIQQNAIFQGIDKFLIDTVPLIREQFSVPNDSNAASHLAALEIAFFLANLSDEVRNLMPEVKTMAEAIDALATMGRKFPKYNSDNMKKNNGSNNFSSNKNIQNNGNCQNNYNSSPNHHFLSPLISWSPLQ